MINNFIKRYSVFINGLLYYATDSEKDARDYISARWGWNEIATIYDNETRDYIFTGVSI